ncbi:hypothetical protein Tco_0999199, partial [Tanacetum coccineum]
SEIRLDTPYGDKWIRRIGVNFLGVRDKIKSIKIMTINHIKCVSVTDEQLCIRRIGSSGYAGSGIDHYAFLVLSWRCLNPFVEIPSGEIKVHIDVLLVLWGNRLPIPDGSLPLSSHLKGGGNNKNNKSETDKSLLDHGRLAYRCGSFQKGRGSPGRNKTPGPWSARIPM